MKKESDFYRLIENICEEKNIKMRDMSFNYIIELEKNDKIRHIIGNSLDLNSASSYKIASDKYATYAVLKHNNIPTIEYNMIFNPDTRSEYYFENGLDKALNLFEEYGQEVILKANDSSQGKDVYLINDKELLREKILKLFNDKKDNVSICPFYRINFEYRVIMLDNKILFCYKKQKPYVMGNGKNKLKDLIDFNEIDEVYDSLNLEYIPEENEKVEISWKHNLSQGAIPIIEIEEEKRRELENIAKSARDAIGLRFASIDIAETIDNKLFIMEANSSVCMKKFAKIIPNGYEIEKNVFSEAIDAMFE